MESSGPSYAKEKKRLRHLPPATTYDVQLPMEVILHIYGFIEVIEDRCVVLLTLMRSKHFPFLTNLDLLGDWTETILNSRDIPEVLKHVPSLSYPFHLVCRFQGDAKVIMKILDAYPGAAKHADRLGDYPLHVACWNQGHNTNLILKILDAYPDAASKANQDGTYPLHVACGDQSDANVIMKIFDAYPDAASKANEDGDYPLHVACEFQSNANVILKILDAYPDAASKANQHGQYPLHLACEFQSNAEVITKILNEYPDTAKHADSEGDYPFHVA